MTTIFIIDSLITKIKKWYHGKYIPPPENDPNSPLVIISPGHYKQPFLAKVFNQISKFWLSHWQWVLGFFLAIASLIVAIYTLLID